MIMATAAQQSSFGRTPYYVLTGGLAIIFLFPLVWSLIASVSPQAATGQRIGYGLGNYTTLYSFGAGLPSAHRTFWFQIASLPMGDYPYAPADSRRVDVIVGGHPHAAHRRARRP